MTARQGGDDRPLYLFRYNANRLGVRFRGDRKTRFDQVDTERRQLPRQLELLVDPHGEAGRLFAVTQGRIEDGEPIGRHKSSHDSRTRREVFSQIYHF
jgi:hypothetical protein